MMFRAKRPDGGAMCAAAKSSRDDIEGWLPLWMHLCDTAGVIGYLYNEWLPYAAKRMLCRACDSDELDGLVDFLALTHDVGKMTPVFQTKISSSLPDQIEKLIKVGLELYPPEKAQLYPNRSPHAMAGENILLLNGCPDEIAAIVGAHHGKPQTIMEDDAETTVEVYFRDYTFNDASANNWKRAQSDIVRFALDNAGVSDIGDLPIPDRTGQLVLTGLLIMADWIASNTEYFPLIPLDDMGSADAYPERVENAVKKLDLPAPWEISSIWQGNDTFFERFGFDQNVVQDMMLGAATSLTSPGIMILEAPMGSGKTEAALAATEIISEKFGQGGLFFALPTQATSNSIFDRMLSWAKSRSDGAKHAVELAHSMSQLNGSYNALFRGKANISGDEDGLIVHSFFRGRKKALLSDFVAGTVDQLLMAALKQKHVMLRHLGLVGKVVVIDECHAYDAYMNTYLDRALNWLGSYGAPVLLLSATLPAKRREELIRAYLPKKSTKNEDAGWTTSREYPLLTWTDGDAIRKISAPAPMRGVSVRLSRITHNDICGILREKLEKGGCACVIANTVKSAQTIADIVRSELPDREVLLFHAAFVAPERAERERELMRRVGKHSTPADRDGLIVIGTQVLEQSLDLDFDVMLTELCPMDLLLQRIGRLHRHDRARPSPLAGAECFVILGDDGKPDRGSLVVYGAFLLTRTMALLPDTANLPGDIPELVQNTYDMELMPDGLPEDYEKEKDEFDTERKTQERYASSYRIISPEKSRNNTTIHGLLDTDVGQADGEAQVRGGDPSIEVLVMTMKRDGSVAFLPSQYDGAEVPRDHVPSNAEGERIARQRLRLPHAFCTRWKLKDTLSQLEAIKLGYFSEWSESSWLKDELFLLLDENMTADLAGYHIIYSRENGLEYEKEAEKN